MDITHPLQTATAFFVGAFLGSAFGITLLTRADLIHFSALGRIGAAFSLACLLTAGIATAINHQASRQFEQENTDDA